MRKAIALLLCLAVTASCQAVPASPPLLTPVPPTVTGVSPTTPTLTPLPSPMPAPSGTPRQRPGQQYAAAFGVDYGKPEQYLAPGEQTRLTNTTVVNSLRRQEQSLAHLGEIYFWIKRQFTTWSAGGQTIGIVTTDQLLAERRLGGCHDWGLVYASVARELGYPAVLVDTASIAWAQQFQAGQQGSYVGHVFVEVFVAGQWVLVDSTNNWYVADGYDPANPVIPLRGGISGATAETSGFYVLRKGLDTWGYGVRNVAELHRLMADSARQLKIEALVYPQYTFQRFP